MQFATAFVPCLSHVGLLPVIHAAFEAGEAIMQVYGDFCAGKGGVEITRKQDDSPLTRADMVSHETIIRHLHEIAPEIPVVSEESYDGASPQAETYWLVDPLDGTKEFLKASGEFTVNIALIHQRFPVFGVVYAPALDECYLGGEGLGAYRYREGRWQAIPLPAARNTRLRVIASKSHLCEHTSSFIAALGECDMVQAGSSLKFCRIATGDADIYPRMGPTSEWDTAAAQAIVEAMGGSVADLQGERLVYGKNSILNPSFIVTSVLHKGRHVHAG